MIHKYLLFKIQDKLFALRLIHIKEVLLHKQIEKLPKGGKNIKGVFNLRGQIIPVVDFAHVLGVDGIVSDRPQILVVEGHGTMDFSFEADDVIEVIKIDDDLLCNKIDNESRLKKYSYSIVTEHADHPGEYIYVLKGFEEKEVQEVA